MTILIKYIEKIKIAWLSKILASLCLINDFACIVGFFVMPFIKYPESAKILSLIFWSYAAIIFCASMIIVLHRELKTNQKEIDEYKKDKVVYIVGRLGALLYFVSMFCLIFLARNDYMNISLFSMIGIAVLGLLLLAIIIAMLTQYKNNYVKMAKDTINFLLAFFVVILFSILMLAGILAHGNENFPKYFSEFLVGISAIPLLLGGIYLVCKMFLSSKMLNEKSDALPVSIVLFIAIGIVTCILLRYAITDCKMQEIMTTIFASILGGAITLAGVAWTIKKGDMDRRSDIERIEGERKEEERKKLIPHIMFANGHEVLYAARVEKVHEIDFRNSNDVEQIKNRTYYSIQIKPFTIKNVSNSNIILKGLYLNELYYNFSYERLVAQNDVCQVQIGINYSFAVTEKITSIRLLVSDILGYEYLVECQFYSSMDDRPQKDIACDNVEYTVKTYTYAIESLSLPLLHKEEATNE